MPTPDLHTSIPPFNHSSYLPTPTTFKCRNLYISQARNSCWRLAKSLLWHAAADTGASGKVVKSDRRTPETSDGTEESGVLRNFNCVEPTVSPHQVRSEFTCIIMSPRAAKCSNLLGVLLSHTLAGPRVDAKLSAAWITLGEPARADPDDETHETNRTNSHDRRDFRDQQA